MLVEGVRSSAEVMAAGAEIRFVVRSPRLLDTEAGRALASRWAEQGVEADEVEDAELAELSDTEHPQGVLCVCTEPGLDLARLGDRDPRKLLLLDAVQDPGNMGTLIRAARAFGVDAVIVLDGSVDPWNPKAVRGAAGASFHMHIAREPWAEAGPWLKERSIEILAADAAGEDGDFGAKVAALEAFDKFVPALRDLGADVLMIAGDHSTPTTMAAHSWHPVPFALSAANIRPGDTRNFDEQSCLHGPLGTFPATEVMPLAMAHAGRLAKYGA